MVLSVRSSTMNCSILDSAAPPWRMVYSCMKEIALDVCLVHLSVCLAVCRRADFEADLCPPKSSVKTDRLVTTDTDTDKRQTGTDMCDSVPYRESEGSFLLDSVDNRHGTLGQVRLQER